MHSKVASTVILLTAAVLLVSGCVLKPKGMDAHVEQLKQQGQPYQKAFAERKLPEVPTPAAWRDVLRRAFLANGDLEAAYWEWNAAVAEIDQQAAYPNSNINLGFDFMFTDESMKAWDRTTLSAGFDSSTGGLMFPTKVAKAGEVALMNAKAAAARFEGAKFDLQKKVLSMYLELALAEEKVRIMRTNLTVLQLSIDTAPARIAAGAMQVDLHRLAAEKAMAENELATMEAEARSMRAQLNGMMARPADAPLVLAEALPDARTLAADDAELIRLAVHRNPRLAELASQVQGRKHAVEMAKQAYIPDFSPTAAITGNVSQSIGAMVMVPTALPKIRGMINEEKAMLRSVEAMARQTRSDRAAEFVAGLYALRNNERQIQTLQDAVIPALERVVESYRQTYAAGKGEFMTLIDAQRTLLETRTLVAEARIARERRLAEIEAIAGVDIETLAKVKQ